MKKVILFLVFILFLQMVVAECESGQVDINSASLSELDELIGIGPAYAGRIIENRPFESLDDLIIVSGIGEITLQKIKDQGLACVGEEGSEDGNEEEEPANNDEEPEGKEEDPEEQEPEKIIDLNDEEIINQPEKIIQELEIIKLGSASQKDIKTKENSEFNNNNYAIYGLILFFVLIVCLLIMRKQKFNKNEFR